MPPVKIAIGRSTSRAQRSISSSGSRRAYEGLKYEWKASPKIELPSVVIPEVGALVDIRTVIEVDLAAVRTVLRSEEMRTYVRDLMIFDGNVSELGNPMVPIMAANDYNYWRETEGPQRAKEIWVIGQRVAGRAATATVQTMTSQPRKRRRRMQYQRNP